MMANHTIGERSASEMVQDVVRDMGDVVRGEVRLAKAEISEKAAKAGKAGGYFGVAALCGVMGFACLVLAGVAGLALVMPIWLAALLMSVFLVCIAAAGYAGGKAKMKDINPVPERTVQTIKDDIQWAKHRTT
jgi:Flp pilus assembly protein TadB